MLAGPIAISGTLPVQLRNLTSLQEIRLHTPALSGSLPGSVLRAMPALTVLSASDSRLSGSLPSDLCPNSSQLGSIYLDTTLISGTLPAEWAASTMLQSLAVSPRERRVDAAERRRSHHHLQRTGQHLSLIHI